MSTSQLHPTLCVAITAPGYEHCQTLVLDCPVCRQQFSIQVHEGLPDMVRRIWQLKQPPGNSSWAAVSIYPSIQEHPQARNVAKCNAHFSIDAGQVVLH